MEARVPPERTTRGWVLLASPILAAVVFLGAFALAGLIISVIVRPPPTGTQIQQMARTFLISYPGQMSATVVVYVAVFISIWLLLPKSGPASLQSYFPRVSLWTVLLALLSGLVFALFVGLSLSALSTHGIVTFHTTRAEEALVPHNAAQFGMALVAISFVGPIVEETYFRGVLLRWLRSKMPLAVAAIPSAALFAATHFRFTTHVGVEGWVLTAGLFLFGLFAVAWAAGTRSLWPSIAAHGMYNAALIGAPFFAGQGH